MNFKAFAATVHNNFNTMLEKAKNSGVVLISSATGDDLWATYLTSFPEGTNPMFRERTEHDCSCCRNFIKNIGGALFLSDDGNLVSVWDNVAQGDAYDEVAKALAIFVKSQAIAGPFVVGEPSYGAEKTYEDVSKVWNHFHAKIPRGYIRKHLPQNAFGMRVEDKEMLQRAVTEISDDAVEVVLELIDQNSIYRGSEFKAAVLGFKKVKAAVLKAENKDLALWIASKDRGASRIRNTVIGTLLVDISEGKTLEGAVAAFESKTAPTNYKRPKALVTQKMIDNAKETVVSLGLEDSLFRRFAKKEDVSVNDVLFVDGSVRPALLGGAFDGVKATKKPAKKLSKVDSVTVQEFIKDVLPKADSLQMFVKAEHGSKFVSLIAPEHAEAKPLFKWDNGFSWSYDGEVTDSIKERVKRAGGGVDGEVRVSLSWHNADDLDLAIVTNKGERICFRNKSAAGGQLDLDMNAYGKTDTVAPVENITWDKFDNMKDGKYDIWVHNFTKRTTANVGFEVEVEILGKLYTFEQPQDLPDSKQVRVGSIVKKNGVIEKVEGFKEGGSTYEKWGVTTEEWADVELVTKSPNFWNGKAVGNEHIFFMLKDCKNPDATRGFYNEFLRDDLNEHRKVFELLASTLKAAYTDEQLSGVGFSLTQRASILVRVTGAVTRELEVTF